MTLQETLTSLLSVQECTRSLSFFFLDSLDILHALAHEGERKSLWDICKEQLSKWNTTIWYLDLGKPSLYSVRWGSPSELVKITVLNHVNESLGLGVKEQAYPVIIDRALCYLCYDWSNSPSRHGWDLEWSQRRIRAIQEAKKIFPLTFPASNHTLWTIFLHTMGHIQS